MLYKLLYILKAFEMFPINIAAIVQFRGRLNHLFCLLWEICTHSKFDLKVANLGGREEDAFVSTNQNFLLSKFLAKAGPTSPSHNLLQKTTEEISLKHFGQCFEKHFEQYFKIVGTKLWEIFSSWRAEGCPGKTKGQTFLLKRVDLHTSRSKLGRASKHHPKHKSKFWK